MKSISIIIPALNEKDSIAKTIQSIPKINLNKIGYNVQILVVDNGSDDGTGDIARNAGADVLTEPRRGYGFAYKAGFSKAKGDIIVTADADFTYPVKDIPKFVSLLENESLNFITTNRYANMSPGAMTWLHRLGNFILSSTLRLIFRLNIKDSQSGMWIFERNLLDRMSLNSNSMALSQELKIEAYYYLKARCKEVPISYSARIGEVKLQTWKHGMENLFQMYRKRLVR